MRQLLWIFLLIASANSVLSIYVFAGIKHTLTDIFNSIASKPLGKFTIKTNTAKIVTSVDLYNAINSDIIDEMKIVNILTAFKAERIEELKIIFLNNYRMSLVNALKDKLSGKLEQLIVAYLMPNTDYLTQEIYNSIHGINADESALIDTLCLLDPPTIKAIKSIYEKLYNSTISNDLIMYTTDYFQILMRSCVETNNARRNDPITTGVFLPNIIKVRTEVSELYYLVSEQLSTIGKFVIDYPKKNHGKIYEDIIGEYYHGDTKRAALAIIDFAKSPALYYARRFYGILENEKDVDFESLVRLIVMMKPTSFKDIDRVFKNMYDLDLDDLIKSRIKGPAEKLIDKILDE